MNFYGLDNRSKTENFNGHKDRFGSDYMYDFDELGNDDSPYGCQARPLNTMSADRVCTIMTSQEQAFNSAPTYLPINQFLFRVEALTRSTIQGYFFLLCVQVHTLFSDRTADWYWYQSAGRMETSFRKALRQQFKDSLDDWDILERYDAALENYSISLQ